MPLSWLIDAAVMALVALVVLTGGRFLVALASGEDPRDSFEITGRWTFGLLGAATAVGAMGLVQLADIVGMLTMFVGSHPLAFSNGLVAGLGAFVAGGWLDIGPAQFIGVSLMLVGVVMLLLEVDD